VRFYTLDAAVDTVSVFEDVALTEEEINVLGRAWRIMLATS